MNRLQLSPGQDIRKWTSKEPGSKCSGHYQLLANPTHLWTVMLSGCVRDASIPEYPCRTVCLPSKSTPISIPNPLVQAGIIFINQKYTGPNPATITLKSSAISQSKHDTGYTAIKITFVFSSHKPSQTAQRTMLISEHVNISYRKYSLSHIARHLHRPQQDDRPVTGFFFFLTSISSFTKISLGLIFFTAILNNMDINSRVGTEEGEAHILAWCHHLNYYTRT